MQCISSIPTTFLYVCKHFPSCVILHDCQILIFSGIFSLSVSYLISTRIHFLSYLDGIYDTLYTIVWNEYAKYANWVGILKIWINIVIMKRVKYPQAKRKKRMLRVVKKYQFKSNLLLCNIKYKTNKIQTHA